MTAAIFITEPIMKWDRGERGADGYLYRKDLPAGTARWGNYEHNDGKPLHDVLFFVCPCGCGSVQQVGVYMDEHAAKSFGWHWTVDRLKPTLTPSLQLLCACKWHGFLTAGEFVRA